MQEPTTLILGAGASFDYGYPVGRMLRHLILETPKEELSALQTGYVVRPADFLHAFKASELRSIDAFLARRSEFTTIGKLAIARIILHCETDASKHHRLPGQDDWLGYLINLLVVEDWKAFDPSWLTIVTFNYDRLLEAKLHKSVAAAYGKTPEEVALKLRGLRIFHVYGHVGEATAWGKQAPYGSAHEDDEAMYRMARHAAENLVVIPEGRDNDPHLQPIQEAIASSKRICFLGFGFDATNIRRLGGPKVFTMTPQVEKNMVGTALGMSRAQRLLAINRLVGSDQLSASLVDRFMPLPCEAMLSETCFLET